MQWFRDNPKWADVFFGAATIAATSWAAGTVAAVFRVLAALRLLPVGMGGLAAGAAGGASAIGGALSAGAAFLPGVGLLGGLAGLDMLGEQRDNSPERQALQRSRWGSRGALPGFYGTQPAPAPTDAEKKAREKWAFDYFVGQGWSKEQAAGLVAQIRHESNFDPAATGDNGQAAGIAQWHGDRQRNYTLWAGHGMGDVSGDTAFHEQVMFMQWELMNTEKEAAARIKAARTAQDAGAAASTFYERPADTQGNEYARGATAGNILGRLGNTANGLKDALSRWWNSGGQTGQQQSALYPMGGAQVAAASWGGGVSNDNRSSSETHFNITIHAPSGNAHEISRALQDRLSDYAMLGQVQRGLG